MADETPSLHIDTDWKSQAREEKRKLAELEKQKADAAKATPPPAAASAASPAAGGRGAAGTGAATREVPPASFTSLIQSILTQALYYLGELNPRGGEPAVNLDMAKLQLDTLGVLDDKTKGNLTPDEQRTLDTTLYELRARFVSVASQYIM